MTIVRAIFDVLAYISLGFIVSILIFVRFFGGVVHLEYYEDEEENEESQE